MISLTLASVLFVSYDFLCFIRQQKHDFTGLCYALSYCLTIFAPILLLKNLFFIFKNFFIANIVKNHKTKRNLKQHNNDFIVINCCLMNSKLNKTAKYKSPYFRAFALSYDFFCLIRQTRQLLGLPYL